MNKVITFDKSAKVAILELFGKTVDAQGYIVNKGNSAEKVLAADGEPLEIAQFAGIKKGSLVFVKSDINSVVSLADEIQ
jgi:hypothetical protein